MIFLSIMLLQLVAVFHDGHLDADAYVVPADQCEALTQVLAQDWQMREPNIAAVAAWCEEKEDPREMLKKYQDAHPDADKPKKHIPGNAEA